jgi:CPA1 family monovalent cation:H+ antiporter
VLALGGLRGALSMALVLSLPDDFHNRPELIAMVYGVVLFTLVVQGLSLRPAIGAALASVQRNASR